MATDDDRLRAAVEPVVTRLVTRLGYDLEDLRVAKAGGRSVVRVVVDRDEPFGLDDVAEVSRDLSAALDADDRAFAGAYVLEVSSPGVDRPLTLPRHWRRNVGRLVKLTPVEGAAVSGRITAADDTGVTLDVDGEVRPVAYADVRKAVVQVELRRGGSNVAGDPRADAGEEG